jgi:hypothetical protein
VVGPVIGEVTDTTARVLFELSESRALRVILTPPSGAGSAAPHGLEFTWHFVAHVPSAVTCVGLLPGTRWVVRGGSVCLWGGGAGGAGLLGRLAVWRSQLVCPLCGRPRGHPSKVTSLAPRYSLLRVSCAHGLTGPISLCGCLRDVRYGLTVAGLPSVLGSVQTLGAVVTRLEIAAAACDKLSGRGRVNLW